MPKERSRGPVEVRLGSDEGVAARVAGAAAALGAEIAVTASDSAVTMIGDVDISAGAEAWRIEAALLRALGPRHVLFLCVANSARSQLAEGIARSLAGQATKISSAGSAPTSVRPQAIRVLDEIGVDISAHRSTGLDDVERSVDAVITLCAEEVCPVWLEDAWRLHWGLPDPADVAGTDDEKLEAFRRVREQLRRRLGVLLG